MNYENFTGKELLQRVNRYDMPWRVEHDMPKFVRVGDDIKELVAKEMARIRVNLEETLARQRKRK